MRLIVMGQQAFGKSALETILDAARDEVVAVYCAPGCAAIGVPAGLGEALGEALGAGSCPRVSNASAETGTSRTISSSSDNFGTGRPPTVIARA